MAFFDVEHFVKSAGYMEACGIAVRELLAGIELLEGEPFLLENVYSILLR